MVKKDPVRVLILSNARMLSDIIDRKKMEVADARLDKTKKALKKPYFKLYKHWLM